MEILEVRYLSNTKARRGSDERTANGIGADGTWSIIIPESVLVEYFSGIERNTGATLYGVLGIGRDATTEEIRKAFRQCARSWHTDVNRLFDSTSTGTEFIRVKAAYDILSNPDARARYDAGLALEATLRPAYVPDPNGYRPPRRCGYVLCDVDGNTVTKIHNWQEIYNQAGKKLNTTWNSSSKSYEEIWI